MPIETTTWAAAVRRVNEGKGGPTVHPAAARTPLAGKYGAIRTVTENGAYDSKHEARRVEVLFEMQAHGLIRNVEVHPTFDLCVNGVAVGKYEADARFTAIQEIELITLGGPRTFAAGEKVVVDAKGCKTPVYKLKRKLMLAIHGIEIIEV
jgi:Protein of unknown function (DUF1064)